MKVSLNTAKYYLGGEVWPDVDDLVAKIGAQLGAVEEVIEYGKRYDGIIVAKVVECNKHPNADKLSVCKIDVGKDELVQVVCGAPNVREGLLVAWISPGATVPATYDKDPFILESRELRGQMSHGMLASASELGISNDHSGLLEIDPSVVGEEKAKPGTPFKNLYNLNDWVIDLENKMFTHRPDCFGILGVAREFAGIYHTEFNSPDWYLGSPEFADVDSLLLKVHNQIPDLCPRFMAVAMSDVDIKPSPLWLQALLTRVGIKPINNIVDMTNHLSYLTGQPLHAYDYDKIKTLSGDEPTLLVRKAHHGEKIKLLNGKEIEPAENTIMIATDKVAVGIGGVMGGSETEVDDNTKNIIIECANFDMYAIRRSSMIHGLFTDAVTRFNKGQSPLQNPKILAQAMQTAVDHAGAKQASIVHDLHELASENQEITIDADFINSRLGTNIPGNEIVKLLSNVEFDVQTLDDDVLVVKAPFWRMDIELKEDIVEEVGRLYGYDKLPKNLPKKSMSPSHIDPMLELKTKLRRSLSAMGANELLTYSFVNGKLLENAGQDPEQAFKLSNALSPDLQYYRLSLTPSLLNHVRQNIKAGHDKFALFELGKIHNKTEIYDAVPKEFDRLAVVLADKDSQASAYFYARKFFDELTGGNVELKQWNEEYLDEHDTLRQLVASYDKNRSAMIAYEGRCVGVVGEFDSKVAKKFKLPEFASGFEIFLSTFENIIETTYLPLSRYPSVSQDICLELDRSMLYADLELALDDALANSVNDILADKQLIDIYADDKMSDKKRITFRLKFVSYDRTLTENTVNELMGQIEKIVTDKTGAKRI